MYQPTKSASGIDMPIVNVPHALCSSALTTARPSPASAMMTMKRMARAAVVPATGPISARAMSASERAAAARRRPQDDHVVDGAGEADAADQPDEPGRIAELRGEDRADERPGARDRREMVAEQHPARGDVVVVAVRPHVRGRRPAVVQAHHLRRDEGAVVAVGDGEDPEDREDDVEGPHRSRF